MNALNHAPMLSSMQFANEVYNVHQMPHLGNCQEAIQQHCGQEEGLLMQPILTSDLNKPADSYGPHGRIDVKRGIGMPAMILHVVGVGPSAILCGKESPAW